MKTNTTSKQIEILKHLINQNFTYYRLNRHCGISSNTIRSISVGDRSATDRTIARVLHSIYTYKRLEISDVENFLNAFAADECPDEIGLTFRVCQGAEAGGKRAKEAVSPHAFIRELRTKHCNITQEEMEDHMGIVQSTLSKREHGDRNMSLSLFCKMAIFYFCRMGGPQPELLTEFGNIVLHRRMPFEHDFWVESVRVERKSY